MTIVETPSGRLRGRTDDGVTRFLGVRYAAPPVGRRRFRAPVADEGWSGIRDALASAPAPPQVPPPGLSVPPAQSEDCLFLDVATPAADDARRPVIVWFHGGAFRFGWAGDVDGAGMAARGDVVVVSVGYRLGLLGFAALDHLDPSLAGSANGGLRDQVEALRWIRRNIAALGGDPDRVTIAGQSAGGESVAVLLGTPAADGLYHRAIVHSATVDVPTLGDRQRRLADRAAQALGRPGSAEGLVSASVEDLLTAQATAVDADPPAAGVVSPHHVDVFPCVDGTVVHLPPREAVCQRGADGVPLLVGTTRHEGTLLDDLIAPGEPDEGTVREAFAVVGVDPDAALAAYRDLRPGGTLREVLVDAGTDSLVRAGCLALADAAATHGNGAWVSLFTWETDAFGGRLGATHALDLPAMWGWWDRPRWAPLLGSHPWPTHLTAQIQGAWCAFARHGDPNGDGLAHWPAHDPATRPTLVLDEAVAVAHDPDRLTRRLWEEIA